ncbi:NAD-dependent epimerase/dehydratase family protein [Providencia rettgeri]|uniref:NAD-dependent epimerase/dehydratase family protein n=1 Tax=Providencia rettgeri TaxID=587 RepID=UPI00384ACFE8
MRVTIIGANGFVGKELVKFFTLKNYNVIKITRGTPLPSFDCGYVIYAAGYGDCQSPIDVLNGNIEYCIQCINSIKYKRFIYFSSTRVYMGNGKSNEDTNLKILQDDSRSIFNLSKLIAEKILLSYENTTIIRPSNIYGAAFNSKLFLPSLVRDSLNKKNINMYVTKNYEKDYIHIEDVCQIIDSMINKENLKFNLYNVASGYNITSEKIANIIESETKCNVNWHDIKHEDYFPPTSIDRIKEEFNFTPLNFEESLIDMIDEFRELSQ